MTEVLHVNGSTTQERHGIIAAVDALLQACGASVTDYSQFSNVSATVSFEIAAGKLPELADQLRAVDILLSRDTLEDLERFSHRDPSSIVTGTIQITFFHHEPDLERVHTRSSIRLHW